MFTKMQLIKAGLYTGLGFLAPVGVFLASDAPMTARAIAACIVAGLMSGGNSLKAFTSDPKAN